MEKQCFKCGEIKPLEAFYKHPMMLDGHLNKCAECTKSDVRANRKARIEYYQAYDRVRAKQPHRVEARKQYALDKPSHRPETNPQKYAARNKLHAAVRDGKITRPPECEICSASDEVLHGHHEDYSKPLEVIWVCPACHSFIHAYWRAAERMAA
jgi:hypothetical protein